MAEVRHVHVLSEIVANQIAAGEVVERPASVVKELVENAIDAQATRIDVEIEAGGTKRVTIIDNGCGMCQEDAVASLERQATSKIATPDDITHIHSFGFRGEAIPSIASVSRFRMITRPASSESATELIVTGGVLDAVQDAGHPVGTTVHVRDLFFNVPARRKFLRAVSTEQARIRQILITLALAHPMLGLSLTADGRTLFRLPTGDSLVDRICALLGNPMADALLPVDNTLGAIHVHGYVAAPSFMHTIGSADQYIFINKRPASAPQIQYALRESFPAATPKPLTILFIDLPPEQVDVNVHPAKREVRFRDGTSVINAIMAALSKTFSGSDPEVLATPQPPVATQMPLPTLNATSPLPTPQMPRPVMPPARQPQLPLPQVPATPPSLTPITIPPVTELPLPQQTSLPWQWCKLAAVLDANFCLLTTDQGYLTLDTKAALERILYESLLAQEIPSQQLLLPETLQLSPVEAERVMRWMNELQSCGFGISTLPPDSFLIDALPVVMGEASPKQLITTLANELENTGVKKGAPRWQREWIARAAARAASQTSDTTSQEAIQSIIHRLAHCEMPYTTPRGRPVMILTTLRELRRRFQRD